MTGTKLSKGETLVCVPCGREVIVDCCGASENTLWCCGEAMQKKPKTAKKTKTK